MMELDPRFAQDLYPDQEPKTPGKRLVMKGLESLDAFTPHLGVTDDNRCFWGIDYRMELGFRGMPSEPNLCARTVPGRCKDADSEIRYARLAPLLETAIQ